MAIVINGGNVVISYYLHHNMIVAISGYRRPDQLSEVEFFNIAERVFPEFKNN